MLNRIDLPIVRELIQYVTMGSKQVVISATCR